jgi:hypothetical protein
MFPTIAESAALVSIILLLIDALPTVPSSRPTGCRCTIALAGALVRVSGAGCLQT